MAWQQSSSGDNGSGDAGQLRILHTNDLHGKLSPDLLPQLLDARKTCDLYFDTGDAIKAGNLGVPLAEEEVWRHFQSADCTFGVLGNRESHLVKSAFEAKLKGATHPLLCSNLRFREAPANYRELTLEDGFIRLASHPLPLAAVVEMKGKLIGVVGGMVAMVTPSMKTQGLSAYHWDNPLAVLQTVGEWLRPQVDWLFALTHIGLGEDRNLAEATAVFDGIFSGHSHDVLFEPEWVGSSPILQGGSHGRYFSVSTWTKVRGLIDYSLVPWKTTHS